MALTELEEELVRMVAVLLLALQTPGFGTIGKEASPVVPGRMTYNSEIYALPAGMTEAELFAAVAASSVGAAAQQSYVLHSRIDDSGINWITLDPGSDTWPVCDPDWDAYNGESTVGIKGTGLTVICNSACAKVNGDESAEYDWCYFEARHFPDTRKMSPFPSPTDTWCWCKTEESQFDAFDPDVGVGDGGWAW